ncbi:PseG/SpsG family protein [Pedococcus bigeumensis]|nr:spore coat protein [Pedococcus bigeumensis]
MSAEGALRVAIRCDARPQTGVGHLMRCLALSEELRARGHDVVFLGEVVAVPWAQQLVAQTGMPWRPAPTEPETLAAVVMGAGCTAAVLDGYDLPVNTGQTLRDKGIRVLSLLDGGFGAGQDADVYLDQNLLADASRAAVAQGRVFLAGLEHTLLRNQVRLHRPVEHRDQPLPRTSGSRSVPRVLAVFGGTDPAGAAPLVAPLILATGRPVNLEVVAADNRSAIALEAVAGTARPGQSLTVLPPTSDLASLALGADLVVSAAGSATWELLAVGLPTALACVADNQAPAYRRAVAEGLVVGLGTVAELSEDAAARDLAVRVLRDDLADHAGRWTRRQRGLDRIDGRGRERVVDAFLGARR